MSGSTPGSPPPESSPNEIIVPCHAPDTLFWCFYARGFVQQQNRRVGIISSLKYLRMSHPELGKPDDTYLPFIPNPDYKGVQSPYQVNVSAWYSVEVRLEEVRLEHYPQLPSRLSVIYVFDSVEAVELARQRYPHQFADRDLVKLRPINCEIMCSYSRHDMQWIDILRDYNVTGDEAEHAIHSYWQSKPFEGIRFMGQHIHSKPLWEVLFDGALTFVD